MIIKKFGVLVECDNYGFSDESIRSKSKSSSSRSSSQDKDGDVTAAKLQILLVLPSAPIVRLRRQYLNMSRTTTTMTRRRTTTRKRVKRVKRGVIVGPTSRFGLPRSISNAD